ncbi:MAG: hypothetical protein KGH87_06670 [Thaumarchaeota archaeon]|nr:hypothetical protein [Candidatus Nitrosotalea sp.]MDE1813209.1 hypothetical protein [Nitrososphaerota archaeon]MDE1839586.1 hypothetical protein [Nitrososphaerota archaeon]
MKTLHLTAIIASVFFIMFLTGHVYATCDTVNGKQTCLGMNPIQISIQSDKSHYENSDKPVITITGVPNKLEYLKIDNQSGTAIFSHSIEIPSTGVVNYTLDISSYKLGVYSVIASTSTSNVTAHFVIGLPSGPPIALNVVKNTYAAGDSVKVLGAEGPDRIIQLSLIDPNGNVVKSIQTNSDNTGQFSSNDLKIPTNAISGIWQINATHGISYSSVEIKVNSSASNDLVKNNTNETIRTYGGGGDVVTITLDPLGQFKSGIPAKNITCQKDFVLVIKSEDSSPACVYASHAAQLLIRGWAEPENQKTNLQSTIKVTGSDSLVTYDITGGKLLGIIRDVQGKRLFIPIQSNTDGNVKLTLPRSVIDTNLGDKNDTFYIMTNSGSIGIFNETDTSTDRTITIPFEKGDNMIQMSVMSWLKEMASIGLGLNKTATHGICDVPYNYGTGHSSPLYDNGTIIHTGYTPVLYMHTDSTGKICVQYYHSTSQSNVGARVFDANNLANDTNNVTISSSQNTITTRNTTVVYTVNTGHKAGFYGISFSCGGQAFAVGYDNQSRIILDDFPWYGQTFYCLLQTYEYKITGLHNVGVYYIKTVSHEQLLYDITNTTVTSVHLTPTSQNVTFSLHVRSFDKPVDFMFDYKDSTIDQSKTDPGFVKSFDVCNWNVANRDLVKSFPILGLGHMSVSDNPVTFKPWSNGTYTFSIITKDLDDGYYGLNPVVYGRPAGITDSNTGLNYAAYDYPITVGVGSSIMNQSGVCNR